MTLKIYNGGLSTKRSPGGRSYSRDEHGKYHYRSFVLGGCGGGDTDAKEIAQDLVDRHRQHDPISFLSALGWEDVIAHYEVLEAVQVIRDSEVKIQRLRDEIEILQPIVAEHGEQDSDYWRVYVGKAYQGRFDEGKYDIEELSLVRLHQAMKSQIGYYMRAPKSLAEKKAQLDTEQAKLQMLTAGSSATTKDQEKEYTHE